MAPLIPETVMDAPTQRLYFLSFCALVQVSAFVGRFPIEVLINDLTCCTVYSNTNTMYLVCSGRVQ